jgi:hypothetical protein
VPQTKSVNKLFLDIEAEYEMKSRIMDNIVNTRPLSRKSRTGPQVTSAGCISVVNEAARQVIEEEVEHSGIVKFLHQDESVD